MAPSLHPQKEEIPKLNDCIIYEGLLFLFHIFVVKEYLLLMNVL